jgi:hypothetical protein
VVVLRADEVAVVRAEQQAQLAQPVVLAAVERRPRRAAVAEVSRI